MAGPDWITILNNRQVGVNKEGGAQRHQGTRRKGKSPARLAAATKGDVTSSRSSSLDMNAIQSMKKHSAAFAIFAPLR